MKSRKNRKKYIPWMVRVFCSLMVFVVTIFGAAIIAQSNLLRAKISEIETDSIQRQVEHLNGILDQLYLAQLKKTDHLLADVEFFNLLKADASSIGEQYQLRGELSQCLNQAETEFGSWWLPGESSYGINTFFSVLTNNEDLRPLHYNETSSGRILSLEDAKGSSWYSELMDTDTQFVWGGVQTIYGFKYLVGFRKVTDISGFNELAVLKINIPLSDIRRVLEDNTRTANMEVRYLDEHGQLLFCLNESDEDQGMTVCRSTSSVTGNTLIYAFSEQILLKDFQTFNTTFVIVMALILAVGIVALFFISRQLTRRVRSLVNKTRALSAGDFSVVEIPVKGNDEIADLERHFDNMVIRLKQMVQNELRFKERLEEMKVELLQEQINPHLLYNTLAMIRYQARKADLTDMAELAGHLITFYRRFLNEGNYITTIDSELTMIEQYIEVVKKVYALDLEVEYDVEDGIRRGYAVKLFLQPVVENAILHGIRPLGKGLLKISAKRQGKSVVFSIFDNGSGIEHDTQRELQEILSGQKTRDQMKSVGLFNVNQRIRLLYGEAYGLSLESTPGECTVARVSIPVMDEEERSRFEQQHGFSL